MKCLKDFEKDLNKCSKCGLCQQSCPVFQFTGNDCSVSKGKFIMLHGVTKGDLKLSKNINKYLDLCLKCGKCTKFCPSGIDAEQIINTAKAEYMNSSLFGKFINFIQSHLIFSNIIKIGAVFSRPFRPRKKKFIKPLFKVLYFKGCVNQVCPRTDKYIQKIFKNIPIEISEPDFDCCGLPFLSEGNSKRFEQTAEYNSKFLNDNFDYLITDCASCESTILSYPDYIENLNFPKDLKSVNWGDLIAAAGIKFVFNKPLKVTFHKPCHLKNDNFFGVIMNACKNVEYIKMENYDDCCGFAGSFSIKNRSLSKEISKIKAQKIKNTGADYVITVCPSCILGLKQGLYLENGKTKVVSLLEFLSKADKIVWRQ